MLTSSKQRKKHDKTPSAMAGRARRRDTENSTSDVALYFVEYMRQHWGQLSAAGVCLIVAIVMQLARPWPLKVIFDFVLVPESKKNAGLDFLLGYDRMTILLGACCAVIIIAALQGSFQYLQLILAGGAGQQMIYTIRLRLYNHIQRLSLGFHTRSHSGDLLSRMIKEVAQLRDFLSQSAVQLAGDVILVAGLIAVMLALDWRMTLLSLLLFPLLFFLIVHFSGQIRGLTRKRLQREGRLASLFSETLAAIQEIQLYSSEEEEQRRFRKQSRASLRADLRALRSKGKLLRGVEMVTAVGTCLVLWWGVRRVISGMLTPGDLLVFLAYLRSLYKPIRKIANVSVQAAKAVVAAERIMEILQTELEIQDAPDAIEAPNFRGDVEFRDVSFQYEAGQTVLLNAAFRIPAGTTVALLGHSGAGKSTLISLVPRLYDPAKGAILIDGVDIRRYTLASLRDQVTVMPQDPVLFGSSIRENIAYGNPSADEKQILRAVRLAQAEEFIEQLPDGYDTAIGERGAKLSGGQRQRIAIARALLRDTPIVVLDEPMTGVDTASEALILKGLDSLLRDRTAFVIAHRISTALNADLAIVMKAGRVVEVGPPQELLHRQGHFRSLAESQFGSDSLENLFGSVPGGVVQ